MIHSEGDCDNAQNCVSINLGMESKTANIDRWLDEIRFQKEAIKPRANMSK